jgi:uncharacterized protein YebE (UPF0316 family)
MEAWITGQALLWTGAIFLLRVTDMTLDTLRVLFVMRGRKGSAWLFGFGQSALFVMAISSVLANLDNPLNIVAYAAGFATGNVIGISLEERLAIGFSHMRIISPRRGDAIAQVLRNEGFAVTELSGRGKDGTVNILSASVKRKNAIRVNNLVQEIDPDAFVTIEEVRAVRRGFWRA